MTLPGSLAIIAGGGAFPKLTARHLRAKGVHVFIVHLKNDSEFFDGFPGITAVPENLDYIFKALRANNIKNLVLIGRMKRPKIMQLRPDWLTVKVIPRILYQLAFGGDDALLKSVRRMLEGQGFALHAAQEFIEGLTAPAGVMGKKSPDADTLNDVQVGIGAARRLGELDIGQAVVVRKGFVVGKEDKRGTDFLITYCKGEGGVLVKMAKPQQDRALDLPSIGPDTVKRCVESGLSGIAIEAGSTLIAEREETMELADRYGIFVMGVK